MDNLLPMSEAPTDGRRILGLDNTHGWVTATFRGGRWEWVGGDFPLSLIAWVNLPPIPGELMSKDELADSIRFLSGVAALARRQADRLQLRLAEQNTPFERGDIIEWAVGRSGATAKGIVTGFKKWSVDSTTLIVTRLRKDGTTGTTDVPVRPYNEPRLVVRPKKGEPDVTTD